MLKWCASIVLLLACTSARAAIDLITIGDSTVANQNVNGAARGWGQMLPENFTGSFTLTNRAMNGTSAKSYYDTYWTATKALAPDYILIQFGTNDIQTNPVLHTDPATTYRDYLRSYIDESRALGTIPILVTPVGMRYYKADGVTIDNKLAAYASAMRIVADEKSAPLIDLNASSIALYQQLGVPATESMFIFKVDGTLDTTHFNITGARTIAGLVATELWTDVPALRTVLIPEPASLALLVLAVPLLNRRGKRSCPAHRSGTSPC